MIEIGDNLRELLVAVVVQVAPSISALTGLLVVIRNGNKAKADRQEIKRRVSNLDIRVETSHKELRTAIDTGAFRITEAVRQSGYGKLPEH